MTPVQKLARRLAGAIGRESLVVRTLRPVYENALNWMSLGRGIRWSLNGVPCRIDARQRRFMSQHYEPMVAEFLSGRVQEGSVCLDIGANVGVYVLQFAHWVGASGHIVAFEPNPAAVAILENHVRLNRLADQVDVVPAAVGSEPGTAALFAANADGMSRLGKPNPRISASTSQVEVRVTTVDAYCAEHDLAPNWLFIDTEGFEVATLRGARKTIVSRADSLEIVMEVHPSLWDLANTSRDELESLLCELGRGVVPLTGQYDPLAELGAVYLSVLGEKR